MTRPLAWLTAVRDHPDRPPALQRHVLTMLALRLDWSTGAGFASGAQLAADADCDERTVQRATAWARQAGMLQRTRRGHYMSAELGSVASEWQLTQHDTGDRLAQHDTGDMLAKPTRQGRRPNPTGETTQPDTTTPPSRPVTSRPVTSARGAAETPQPPRFHDLCRRCGMAGHAAADCTTNGNGRGAQVVPISAAPSAAPPLASCRCPVCGRLVDIVTGKKAPSGKLRHHGGNPGAGTSWCPGSGMPLAELGAS